MDGGVQDGILLKPTLAGPAFDVFRSFIQELESTPQSTASTDDFLSGLRERAFKRLEALTDEELERVERSASQVKTARAYMRKVLSHQWEHFVEVRDRLGAGG